MRRLRSFCGADAANGPVVVTGIAVSCRDHCTEMLALNDERGARWLSVHNAYLNYAVDLGLPGLTLFLMLLFAWSQGWIQPHAIGARPQ